jgi:hypothetical protein
MNKPSILRVVLSAFALAAACGGDDATTLVVRGHVFDLSSGNPVEGARVVALDESGAPASATAVTDADGAYEVTLVDEPAHVTLRADASGFQTFPAGLRQALPVATDVTTEDGDELVVSSALTEVGLLALAAGSGTGSISGRVERPDGSAGVLVVAENAGAGYSAIVDRDGEYTIFNLPEGAYHVSAYAQGATWAPADLDLTAGQAGTADLTLDGRTLGQVDGTVQMVNPGDGTLTSVLLVVESTFDEALARGATPPGLRVADVTGSYHFDGVPAGRYVVLAAFENDALVRDPDTSISGTSLLHIEVADGATTTVEGFKITGALAILSPGADAPEEVDGVPTFSWVDDSSEDQYHVVCVDAFGQVVWETTIAGASGQNPSVTYEGPALEAGMYYQLRVTSLKDGVPLSASEDLRGVFFLPST